MSKAEVTITYKLANGEEHTVKVSPQCPTKNKMCYQGI
jgi:hypothetical protein